MEFNTYLKESWIKHAKNPQAVAASFSEAVTYIEQAPQINKMTGLVVHVMGEHLGQFSEGVKVLNKLLDLPLNTAESLNNLNISKAILFYTENAQHNISGFTQSEQIRIMATSVSADVGLKKINAATEKFKLVLSHAKDLEKTNPANRTLAITGNNLACALEEKTDLTSEEKDLMLSAALTARKFWEIAGAWLEVERAEYRLAQSYLKAKDYISSIKHANLCLTICEINKAEPLEFFFAYEAIVNIEKAMKQPLRSLDKMKAMFEKLSDGDKAWCEASFKKFN